MVVDKNILFCQKALCLISQISLLDIQHQFLTFIFENIIKKKHFQFMPMKPLSTKISKSMIQEKVEGGFLEKFNEKFPISDKDLEICECDHLEFFLSFFFYSLPTSSPPEDYTVSVENITGNEEILKYHISKDQNLYEEYLQKLFKLMQLPNILKLIKFILLEKSIIVFSKSSNNIIAVTETLLSLISPL